MTEKTIESLQAEKELTQKEIKQIQKEMNELWDITDKKEALREMLVRKMKVIDARIEELKFEEDNYSKQFLMSHKGYYHIGKTDGTLADINDTFTMCYNDKIHFDIFVNETGIGSVYTGVCPKCGYKLNFTNYDNW